MILEKSVLPLTLNTAHISSDGYPGNACIRRSEWHRHIIKDAY